MGCEFCECGPLDCGCVDITFEDAPTSMEEALKLEALRQDAVSKLGREKTNTLINELSLDASEISSWQTLSSMAMWV